MALLAGRTALVTGASGGIGGAISRELAQRGAHVVLTGRNQARLASLQQQLCHPLNHRVIQCDMACTSSINALAKSLDGIDILVNAAGISRDSLAMRQRDDELDEMMQINLKGVMQLCKQVSPLMIRKRSGCIINVSSVVGIHGNVGQSGYAATKAGLIGFTKSLAKELGPRGVRANVIAPGFIDTEMTRNILQQPVTKSLIDRIPLQRLGTVDDVAHAAAFIAESKYMTGQVLVIDGGLFV
ncbi:hypothetical protein H4R22_002777 [Coemansia sp. RSA 1290]|nr:3-oxoacyl-reductase [Coemansia mojavensis]KAJ2630291.1 hypothetical protein H4R22_002777 [Coemansia sp. RSA 1290]